MGLEHALTDWRQLASETYVEEATPGSWVVNAVKEYPDGRLMWLLEVQRGLFPEEVVRGLVSSYERLLHTLCSEPASWGEKVAEVLPGGATPAATVERPRLPAPAAVVVTSSAAAPIEAPADEAEATVRAAMQTSSASPRRAFAARAVTSLSWAATRCRRCGC